MLIAVYDLVEILGFSIKTKMIKKIYIFKIKY